MAIPLQTAKRGNYREFPCGILSLPKNERGWRERCHKFRSKTLLLFWSENDTLALTQYEIIVAIFMPDYYFFFWSGHWFSILSILHKTKEDNRIKSVHLGSITEARAWCSLCELKLTDALIRNTSYSFSGITNKPNPEVTEKQYTKANPI